MPVGKGDRREDEVERRRNAEMEEEERGGEREWRGEIRAEL